MTDALKYRFLRLRSEDVHADGTIRVIASTDAPVDFGGYREVLVHDAESVDYSAARSVLINHDRDQIAGAIRSIEIAGGRATAVLEIAAEARLQTGVLVRDAVRMGALEGVSIGYQTDASSEAYDESTRTVTAKRWAMREITLTPVQADVSAHTVRSLPERFVQRFTPAAPAATTKESTMDKQEKPQADKPAAAHDEGARAREIETLRAENASLKLRGEIDAVASSHGLRGADYHEHKDIPAATRAMMEAKARAEATAPAQPQVRLHKDAQDKAIDAAADGLLGAYGLADAKEKDLGERRFSALDIVRRYAQRMGENVADWNKADAASWGLGKRGPGARAANVTSSTFSSYVLANVMDKAVMQGFANFAGSVSYPRWTGRRSVADFKQFTAAGLDSANLQLTTEDVAFPELAKAEGGYNGSLGLWGGTISLSFQALVNDDLGEFMRLLSRAGAIAQRTIDAQVYAVLNAATWTGNTTSASPLATAGNLDKVRAAFEKKTGPAGAILGNKPRFLLVPSTLRSTALQQTAQLLPGGLQAYPQAVIQNADLETVVTPYLTENGTPANSAFYLAGDPALVDTVTVAFLQGGETPFVMEYDAGATAARNWKIMQAFVAVLAQFGTSIPGIQQGA